MAVALVVLKHQPAKAVEFWSGVVADDGLHRGDPRKAMLHVFNDADFVKKLGAGMIYVSHCWDAFYQGKSLSYPKVTAASLCQPLGTPFAPSKRFRA
jgi:hypothetical protein